MVKYLLYFFAWLISVIYVSLYTFENPQIIEKIKQDIVKKKITPKTKIVKHDIKEKSVGNSFTVEYSKILTLSEKTAFIIYDKEKLNFDLNNLEIFFQNGYVYKNQKTLKINLPDSFTLVNNGGIKTVFTHKNKKFGLISSSNNDCFYTSIVMFETGKEIFKTKCLPSKVRDYNAIGSSNIHHDGKIYLTIGAPEQSSSEIAKLAQNKDSMYGKIIEISKSDLEKIILGENKEIFPKIFTMGHRNPQGLTKINNSFFSVEHGPKGGDEINKIIKNKNYGWPKVSYGTKYLYDENGKSYESNHENNQFEEPLFALVPSVGISSINTCPRILKKYYKKQCLLALSLYGNSLRPGRSIIIFLLNEKMDQIHSIEKIILGGLKLRHFVTSPSNELYEDVSGNIYVSSDKNGIYKLNFIDFR